MTTKTEAGQAVLAAKTRLGLTWAAIAETLGRPLVWTTAALLGQHPVPADLATRAGELLELTAEQVLALQLQPMRGALDAAVPVDPTIYRFYCAEYPASRSTGVPLRSSFGFAAPLRKGE